MPDDTGNIPLLLMGVQVGECSSWEVVDYDSLGIQATKYKPAKGMTAPESEDIFFDLLANTWNVFNEKGEVCKSGRIFNLQGITL